MLRLFAALPVPPDVAGPLSDLQEKLPGAAWRPVENFHITLRFFGECNRDTALELDEALGAVRHEQFPVEIEGCGVMGKREARAVHAVVRPSAALSALAGAAERAARRAGLPPERRRFRPHVTLAYLHGTPMADAQRWAEARGGLEAGPWWADRWHLYESRLGKGPSIYDPVADYVLG